MKTMLTDRFIAGVRCDSQTSVFDTHTRGLVLRVGARTKVWYFVYRKGGPPQWMRLGEYGPPPKLTLAAARLAALDARHAVDVERIDPLAQRRQAEAVAAPQPPALTFRDFALGAFIQFQKGKKKTWADDQAAIERHLLPAWGTLPLNAIERQHVHERLDALVGQGMTIGVNRIQALISRIFTVAMDRSLIDANPADRVIKRFKEQPRDRVLTDEELRTLWTGLDAQPGPASDAVKVRLLLGQRGEETAGALWSEVDLDQGTWSLSSARTKNGRPHIVGLPPTALAIFTRRRAETPTTESRVFGALDLTSDEHKALNAIHGGSYTWKDLRRTVSTRLAGLGYDDTTIGRVLNHARQTVTGKHYNQHAYVEEIRQALSAWDKELQRVRANEPKGTTRVLPMRTR